MSELKPYIGPHPTDATLTEYYLKSEADKVIAELQKQVHDYAQGLYVIQARADKDARHQKYNRCLAMARLCSSYRFAWSFIPEDDEVHKSNFYKKWELRWLELAEKFKEAK